VALDADRAAEQVGAAARVLQRHGQRRLRAPAGVRRVRGRPEPAADARRLDEPIGVQREAAEVGEAAVREDMYVGVQPEACARMGHAQRVGPVLGQAARRLRHQLDVLGRQRSE